MSTSKLYEALEFPAAHNGSTISNRIAMAALTRQRAGENGTPTELHREYYSQRASAGIVVTEGTFTAFTNRAFPGQAGMVNDEHQNAWREVADAVHERGGALFMQLMHGGRMCSPGLLRGAQPEAPSAIAPGVPVRDFNGKSEAPIPRALRTNELPRIIQEFVAAARRAVDAGVDGVEIHSANGYLLHEFLSPVSNTREDNYGGSPANRARLTGDVVRAVANEIGAEHVGLRISPEHNIQGVLEEDREDVLATYGALLDSLSDLNLAYVSVLHREAAEDPTDGEISELLAFLKAKSMGAFILNSGFSSFTQKGEAERLVDSGWADAVAVGRMLIANPDLAERWENDWELNEPDQSTFYSRGAKGYTDYPFHGA